jgi:hypothetical protein
MLVPLLMLAMQASSDPSRASTLYADCKTYHAMLDKSKESSGQYLMQGGMCVGYISGFVEGAGEGRGFCVSNVTVNTMSRVYTVYMDKNPKLFDELKGVALELALAEAYPCKK